jgi:hypothetical protein
VALQVAKKKSKKPSAAAAKGFGRTTTSLKIPLDKSESTRQFYNYLEQRGVSLTKTSLGYFGPLRGVVALHDMNAGDVIISIPSDVAYDLGAKDPIQAGVVLLQEYDRLRNTEGCETVALDMLPPPGSLDCQSCTHFFSDQALEALQSPMIVDETLQQRQAIQDCFDREQQNLPTTFIDGTPLMVEHLQWACWIVTSRALTVQNADDATKSHPLLIPYLDMCNHHSQSSTVLTGKVPGNLQLKATKKIKVGDQITYAYAGGMVGNDRFLQDYGFLDDSTDQAFDVTAQQLLRKRRITSPVGAAATGTRLVSISDMERTLCALQQTTIEEDEALLRDFVSNEEALDAQVRLAIEYRCGLKKAIRRISNDVL